MKNIKNSILVFAMGIALVFLTGCDKEKVLPSSDIPEEITQYVTTHFPDHEILQVVKDRDDLTVTYEVILDGGISLEFNRKKEIVEIDASTALPDSVIPDKILEYVRTNYPDHFITDWELEGKHQKVELNNGLELEFTMDGEFIRIDD